MNDEKKIFIHLSLTPLIILFIQCGVLIYTNKTEASIPTVQILMAESLSFIKIKGDNIKKIYKHKNGEKSYAGKQELTLDCTKNLSYLKNDDPNQKVLLASLSSSTGILEWKHNRYQGDFTVLRKKNKPGCDLIHDISLENYISTLVGKEMGPNWPVEALKAQAVAARTYAFSKKQERENAYLTQDQSEQFYDLENSEKDQVNGPMDDRNSNTIRASQETYGEILTFNGIVNSTYYHSKCGGNTHLPSEIWGGRKTQGYESVECPFCKKKGQKSWKYTTTNKNFPRTLLNLAWKNNPFKQKVIRFEDIQLLPQKLDDFSLTFKFQNQYFQLNKATLRKNLGRQNVFSNNFLMSMNKNSVEFRGEGLGHGVGMCQTGAFELAKRGYNYKQILSFYYPNYQFKKIY